VFSSEPRAEKRRLSVARMNVEEGKIMLGIRVYIWDIDIWGLFETLCSLIEKRMKEWLKSEIQNPWMMD